MRNFMDMVFSAERTHFFQASIKLVQPFPAPELRTRILRTRGFFWNKTGRPWCRTMEMKGGNSASYLARAPCVPLVLYFVFHRGGDRRVFRPPGEDGDHFHCTVEPSPGHIRCCQLDIFENPPRAPPTHGAPKPPSNKKRNSKKPKNPIIPKSRRSFPKSRRPFPKSRRSFPKSKRSFPKSKR